MNVSKYLKLVAALSFLLTSSSANAASDHYAAIKKIVDAQIQPEMQAMHIPGMAVGITMDGKDFVFNYGVGSKTAQKSITDRSLFEIGSISKTFTATAAAYAQAEGKLALTDKVSKIFPDCKSTKFGELSLLNLGTHTPGGLPLQLPTSITTGEQLHDYLKHWKPSYEPGKFRTYNNPGIGILGLITAQSMNQNFDSLMEKIIFPALGMSDSFINVPDSRMNDYVQGYTESGSPTRMSKSLIADEAYGVKTTAHDLLLYIEDNIDPKKLDSKIQRALTTTHTSFFKVGVMTQDLIWEQYPYPVELRTLLEGNSNSMIFEANKATEIIPPAAPVENVWINKTGSTNGCSAYIAFVPAKKLGIVLLANKSYPIKDRVTIAHKIMQNLLQ